MPARLLLLVLVACLLAAGCREDAEDPPGPGADRGQDSLCASGLHVPGARSERDCGGVRVRFPDRKLVPQGLALGPRRSAYISGYGYTEKPGEKRCQVVQVDRATGRVLAHLDGIEALVDGHGVQPCRHGGGAALTRHGLWVAGAGRLWLLDPDLTVADPVRRAWVVELPVKASVLDAGPHALVTGIFRDLRRGHAYRFRYDDLLAPGVTTLSVTAAGPAVIEPSRTRRIPARTQGVTIGPGGLWFTTSHTRCGSLVTPDGDRIAFIPGAEGLEFADRHTLWVVSESGSQPYQRMGGRPNVPTLTKVDLRTLDRDRGSECD